MSAVDLAILENWPVGKVRQAEFFEIFPHKEEEKGLVFPSPNGRLVG